MIGAQGRGKVPGLGCALAKGVVEEGGERSGSHPSCEDVG